MVPFLLWAALAPQLVAAESSFDVGTQLTYRGKVEAASGDAAKGQKTFDLTVWVVSKSDAGRELFWLVDERGNGEFPWPERFGSTAVDTAFRVAGKSPALLFDRGDGRSVVPVRLPLFAAPGPLAADAQFKEGDLELHVDKSTKVGDRPAWQVSVRDPFGPKRELLVEPTGPLVLGMDERVVMGRGEEYRLTLELVEQTTLAERPLESLLAVADALVSLSQKLNVPEHAEQIAWKPEQAELLATELPKLSESAAGTPLSNLVAAAGRDLKLQTGRGDAIAGLQAKFTGQSVGDFALAGLAGEKLAAADLKDQVTLLHFWDYRDEPLHEPYGQIGYLDYLYHRRKDSGLRLYGVAVNGRLADAETRGSAERSVRKLKAFMNLSYPVLLDPGDLLKQFGDPRIIGAELPLFVLIGPDAKILHYHVGNYDVQQDAGLKELDAIVQQALEKP
jgi:hypothetical protein